MNPEMTPEQRAERNAAIYEARKQGATFAALASQFELSKEQVRRILLRQQELRPTDRDRDRLLPERDGRNLMRVGELEPNPNRGARRQPEMDRAQLLDWIVRHGYTTAQAARILGLSLSALQKKLAGIRPVGIRTQIICDYVDDRGCALDDVA